MAIINGTNLAAGIVPFTTEDTYPTHYAAYGKGGHRTVQGLVNRDSIPSSLKEEGMTVFVIDNNTRYIWKKNPNNGNIVEWLEDNSGGGSVVVGSNTQVVFNDNGVLAGSADLTYNELSRVFKAGNTIREVSSSQFLHGAGNSFVTGAFNLGVGEDALSSVDTGTNNTAIGISALNLNESGFGNTALGYNALGSNVTGSGNFALGFRSGELNEGYYNMFLGAYSGYKETSINNKLALESNQLRNDNKDYLIEGDFSQRWVRFNGAIRKRVVNISGTAPLFQGTCTSNGIGSGIVDTSLNYVYNGTHVVIITGGTGVGQIRPITGGSGTSFSTQYSWDTPLDTTSTYEVLVRNSISTENYNSIYFIDLSGGNVPLLFGTTNSLGASVEVMILNNPNNKSLYLGNFVGSKFNIDSVLKSDISVSTKNVKHIFDVYGSNILYKTLPINILQPIKSSTKDLVIDLYSKIYKIDVATATTVTFNIDSSYVPILTGNSLTIELDINMTVASAITWPNNITWIGGSAPTFGSIAKYRLVFRTEDAGTTWIANLAYTY